MSHCVLVGNSYEVAQVNNQPKTGRHNITLIASADPSFTQNADVTSLRICNNNGKRTEDKNPVISEYEKLHRKKRDLYQSLTHHQVLAKNNCVNMDYINQ